MMKGFLKYVLISWLYVCDMIGINFWWLRMVCEHCSITGGTVCCHNDTSVTGDNKIAIMTTLEFSAVVLANKNDFQC